FVTRTMGELYAKQGYNAAALDVFRQLAVRHPEDRGLIDRIEELARLAARRTPPGSRVHDTLEPPAQEPVQDNASVGDSAQAPVAEPMADGSVDTDAPSVTEKLGPLPVTVDPVSVDSATPSESVASEDDVPGSALIDWAGEPKPGEVGDSELPTAAADAGESGKHFTEVELGEGDSWDTDVWAAGFSREERMTFGDSEVEQSTDDGDAETEEAAGAEPGEAAGIDSEVVVDRPPSAELEVATTRWSSDEQAEPVAAAPTDADREPHATQTRHSTDSESNLDGATPEASSHLVAYAPHAPSDSRAPESRPPSRTVHQFFAILGAHRPPSHKMAEGSSDEMPLAASSATLPASAHAFADLFPNESIAEEDTKAAFALSGALAAGRGDPASTPPRVDAPRPLLGEDTPAAPLNAETEEDLRRFREWLDGLAES
nr:hypothetical protein [Gemmatimonadaceae bacterium]